MEKSQIDAVKAYLDFSKSNQFGVVLNDDFNKLRDLTNEIRVANLKSSYEGEKEYNKKKNRYRDILPYDDSRVRLESIKTDDDKTIPGSDYINANIIKSSLDHYYRYVAAQGPTKETVVDFVRMLIQYNIKIVICACNEYEGQKLKCHRYWTDSDSYCFYKNYYVTLTAKPIELDGCIIRQLKIRYTTDPIPTNSRPTSKLVSQSASSLTVNNQHNSDLFTEYEFMQFHLVNWPDHGVPDNIESIISILSIVRQKMVENNRLANESLNKLNPSKSNAKKCQLPLSSDFLLVHCSAGCGRTGTIIAIDQIWNLITEHKLNSSFSLYEIARALREQRIAMIQTLSQYLFFAKATAYLFEKHLKTYEKSQLNNQTNHQQNKPVNLQDTQSNNNSIRNPHNMKIYQSENEENEIENRTPKSAYYHQGSKIPHHIQSSTNTPYTPVMNNLNERSNQRVDSSQQNQQQQQSNRSVYFGRLGSPSLKHRNHQQPQQQQQVDRNNNNINDTSKLKQPIDDMDPSISNHNNSKPTYNSSPLSTVKNKTNRLVTNVFNIFSSNHTNSHSNYNANVPSPKLPITPSSASSSSSSSPSPLSISSNSSASNNVSNFMQNSLAGSKQFSQQQANQQMKSSTTKANPLTDLRFTIDENSIPSATPLDSIINPVAKLARSNSKSTNVSPSTNVIRTPEEISGSRKQARHLYAATSKTKHLDVNNNGDTFSLNSVFLGKGEKNNSVQQSSSTTASPKLEHDRLLNNHKPNVDSVNSSSELYLNDKSMYKKDPGSVCEFLSNKLGPTTNHLSKLPTTPTNEDLKKSIYDIPGELNTLNSEPYSAALDDSATQSSTITVNSSDLASKSSSSLQFKNVRIINNQFNLTTQQTDTRDQNHPSLKADVLINGTSIDSSVKSGGLQKFRKTNFCYYDNNFNTTTTNNNTNLNLNDIENDLSDHSEPPPPLPTNQPPELPTKSSSLSINQTPPIPPARTKARKLSSTGQKTPPDTSRNDEQTHTPLPSPGPQFRTALDRQLPQNSKYVEIKMNNKLLASEAQVNLNGYELNHLSPIIVANGATNSSSSNSTPKSSNRNGMLFDAVPTNYGNDNRKSSQPYYKPKPQKNDLSFTLTLPNKKYLQINNFNNDLEMKETEDQHQLSPFPYNRNSMSTNKSTPIANGQSTDYQSNTNGGTNMGVNNSSTNPSISSNNHRNYIYYLSNFHQFGLNSPNNMSPSSTNSNLKLKKSTKYESVLINDENSELKASNSNKRRSAQIFNL